ncbi:MAG: aspartate carbamoyltransferase [Atribacterota bacterium]|nr:aspartate carbamoyltransferase [Atribacterota bacterium]MDD4895450.1 aspartate carbamoyltransferase [Atribacterota bacterium]MDD5637627.1 aspartate carbamoyltransferase [Atribacterota bacterium]
MLKGKDILNTAQFSTQELNLIMNTAAHYEHRVKKNEVIKDMEGKIVACLFFEPSTRTRLSFESAANRLGARVISVSGAASSSTAKGESLPDTIRTVDGYVDVIVMRHPENGSAQIAADHAVHPFINAGDGSNQHPTQALLDIFTIRQEKGALGGQTVTFLGDLKYGRTVHSLGYFMTLYGNKMIFVSPKALRMPEKLTADFRNRGAEIEEMEDVQEALAKSDIVYVTRIQRERFEDPQEYEKLKGSYIIDRDTINKAKKGITVLHPLPRVDEIATDVDVYEGAAYFRQAHNGMYVRMALLALVSGSI